ncbi:hypothetical protein IFM89_033676 [Coptis chinensis]|uniref:Glucan endo-1,3-beta-D-glucosidase n=1 Tax=Coptis chinensis TaxID=261450 RepID=A0A835HGN7_9MAGN|nr:hypothetical protein IFM89_033676 [Coptis chinensis]
MYFQVDMPRCQGAFVGINIGTESRNLTVPVDVVSILKARQITNVRLFDADRRMLIALANTGVEVLTTILHAAFMLVPAMNRLHHALVASNLSFQVKVSSPQSMIDRPFPPSTAIFNSTWNSTIYQFLQFLKKTRSFYMLNAYPYYGYTDRDDIFPIDTQFLWAWLGGTNEPAATIENAEAYNNNLIRWVLNNSGPPSQPSVLVSTYIYEMFNEDSRPCPVSKKNWGMLYTNGTAVYPFRLNYSDIIYGNSSKGVFCTTKEDADPSSLEASLDWAYGCVDLVTRAAMSQSFEKTGRNEDVAQAVILEKWDVRRWFFQRDVTVNEAFQFGQAIWDFSRKKIVRQIQVK